MKKYVLALLALMIPFKAQAKIKYSKEDIDCITETVYKESRGENKEGKQAVAFVIINRLKDGSFGSSICSIINQKIAGKYQFYHKKPRDINIDQWDESRSAALEVISGAIRDMTDGALYFHSTRVHPHWNRKQLARIGHHVFS